MPDHRFAAAPKETPNVRVVRREWKVLKKGLPADGSIRVRAYEARADLLRAVIVGPKGTPYEGGLFFFDLQLPGDYPSRPPRMKYHSVAEERLNPNLYVDGKVCLSLLGTWAGPSWDPSGSTVLQLLVSVQGLVLVEQPYFNEAGYEKQVGTEEGETNARLYNESARYLCLRG